MAVEQGESCWVYLRSEPGLWTVGYYSPRGAWNPDSDHSSEDDARARVNYLNGGRDVDMQVQALSTRLAEVELRLASIELRQTLQQPPPSGTHSHLLR